MSSPSAVVLAAGEGTRLRPLTKNRPKPMLPAATKPILEHVLDGLIDAGVADVTIVVGYRRDRVQSHFGSTYRDVPLSYVVQEKQLGTGHALLQAEPAVDGATLVVNGDQLVDSRIVRDVVDRHGADAAATLGLIRRADVGAYGGVILEDGRVRDLVEQPRDDRNYLLNAGVYALEPRLFDSIRAAHSRDGEQSLVDGISQAIESGEPVRGVVSEGLWVDATYPWDLLETSLELFDAGVIDGRHEDSSATIHDDAVIRGPVVVGPDCEVGPGAVVGPYACLGENATVDSNAVVERSVVDADTRIGPGATVVDCVTGVGVDVGPGTTIPGGPGDVRVGDRVFEEEALGALLADRVTDRGGVTYVPGTIVGPDSRIESGSTVRGTLPAETEVRS
ncbi:sugar phosphate nucleotidyltransferase [Natronobeatus ordinarius]|uniref:sugar phosphate nucleotidyltransferase n=1 Tax=Natronobeatus ordinarius TaxID=2963433 RepID=UPI0020CE1620|nr:sugar phosphate nucleotidyltransferase [Natronobeatus ordinarius]